MCFPSSALLFSHEFCQGAPCFGYSDTSQFRNGFLVEVMHKGMENIARFTEIRPCEH